MKQLATNDFHSFSPPPDVISLSLVTKPAIVKRAGIKAVIINTSQNIPEFLSFSHSALNDFI
jgi:hypothetical protein